MKHFTIDVSKMVSREAMYDELVLVFNFSEYFGRNLDALAECLGDLINEVGPVTVTLENSQNGGVTLPEWKSARAIIENTPQVTLTE